MVYTLTGDATAIDSDSCQVILTSAYAGPAISDPTGWTVDGTPATGATLNPGDSYVTLTLVGAITFGADLHYDGSGAMPITPAHAAVDG